MIEGEVEADTLVTPLGLETGFPRAGTGRFEVGVRDGVTVYVTDGITRIAELRLGITQRELIRIGIATYLRPAQTQFTVRQHFAVGLDQLREDPRSADGRIYVEVLTGREGGRFIATNRSIEV